ncbi:leucine-rich repeat-containing protein 40-like [Neodiprion fabricii]|uniref:leucine-rich repeat-containing protein 40-like n=1 Tax=Neodiprion fabricii TaxID=2872261 RepID=UPI001ED96CFA|nr:leucine-rich repeat-containing protein 40-like [Neodiprion fabricii]
MTSEKNFDVASPEDKELEKLVNGRINGLLPISQTLSLDSMLENHNDLEDIFKSQEFTKVVDFSMKDNNLTSLPKNFTSNLSSVTRIDVSNNNLQDLEICFESLKNLQELIVDKNRLEELPNDLGELVNLKVLSAAGNKLTIIPESFGNIKNLEKLELSHNKIKSFSVTCVNLDNLKVLNLSFNELRTVPKCVVEGSSRLEVLDLSHNNITEITRPPCSRNLRKFYFKNNPRNEQFPDWILAERFSNLQEVVLDETRFSSFDLPTKSFGQTFSHLKKLSMSKCRLSDTSFDQLSQSLPDLEYLNVGNDVTNVDGNVFWVMPAANLKSPANIVEINIQAAGLPALPCEINMLRNLTRLNVSKNNISSLPEEFCELEKLEIFNAAHNNLYALPQRLGNLTALRVLFLETNKLTSLPDSIQSLSKLECLDLYNNEFHELPKQLEKIPNLQALDIEGNIFKTDNLQISNIEYLKARNILRSMSSFLLVRTDESKIAYSSDDGSISSLEYWDQLSLGDKSMIDTNLSDVGSVENWDISEDSADDYDPTAQPRTHNSHSPFTVSSVLYDGNFCPADLHRARIRDQLAAMQGNTGRQTPSIEEGQFDDA